MARTDGKVEVADLNRIVKDSGTEPPRHVTTPFASFPWTDEVALRDGRAPACLRL